jgi:succinate dehydrogenase/fumarate reductase flavoprotein subunit
MPGCTRLVSRPPDHQRGQPIGSNSSRSASSLAREQGAPPQRYAMVAAMVAANPVQAMANDEERRIRTQFLERQEGASGRAPAAEMQQAMGRGLGVYRTREGLVQATEELRGLRERFGRISSMIGAPSLIRSFERHGARTTCSIWQRPSRTRRSRGRSREAGTHVVTFRAR